ncbi:hypothetical protein SAMN05421776_12331 [Nocardia farcinica]|uniref:Uncharacterized protein n=1 Tax=Nocardia farcinica TaxID=37329 RepID=A0A0H5PAC3_NOCFR|nr:hypothetical protein [Nocardia farcinica]AXK88622.1 hypothetical protein DXT66_26050 [Nocardia farcinica]PFW98720.1 hypothetical protein CJ469_05973 [Nocardia farcinica]PFX04328.1 hypothetical protein CJ468_05574 [Nocardia farcinica]CRY84383.1 Uncharacterised protein [Nocardia farcinica]SIT34307.1 hypothetical protein SAMN05421776_12331 [Nocardia farcinica]
MAELDYAFVADFATVEGGKLTAVGASYTMVAVSTFPVQHAFAVAGRVRAPEETETIEVSITVKPPREAPEVIMRGTLLSHRNHVTVYDGKIGIVFAAQNVIQLTGPGLVEVFVDVDGQRERRLAFEVLKS